MIENVMLEGCRTDPVNGRVVVLDTETTGLDPSSDRICSLALIEVIDGRRGRTEQFLFDPECPVDPGASRVNGFTWKPSPVDDHLVSLKGKPLFRNAVPQILSFIACSPTIAHDAAFDRAFLNAELSSAGYAPLDNPSFDTRRIAFTAQGLPLPAPDHEKPFAMVPADAFDGQPQYRLSYAKGTRTGLNDTASRYGVSTNARGADGRDHGALVDAEILLEVWKEMIRRGDVAKHASLNPWIDVDYWLSAPDDESMPKTSVGKSLRRP